MIIGWLYDQAMSLHTGGQMLSSRLLLQRAPEWAEVKVISPYRDEWLGKCDAYIINQCRYFRPDQLARATPHIWLFHDMLHNCTHQGFILKVLLKKATGCIFKSPFHQESVYGKWPGAKKVPGKAVYATPIDTDLFWCDPPNQTKGTIWLGNYVPEKGVVKAVKWAEENGKVMDFFGFGDAFMFRIASPWVRFHPVLPYGEVPQTLRKYKRLVFLPKCQEAAGRVVVEALLSGCEVVTNDMIGFKSFDWWTDEPDALRKALEEREGEFWETVGEMLG